MAQESTRTSVLQAERAVGEGGVRDARRAEEAAKIAAAVNAKAMHIDSFAAAGGLGFGTPDSEELTEVLVPNRALRRRIEEHEKEQDALVERLEARMSEAAETAASTAAEAEAKAAAEASLRTSGSAATSAGSRPSAAQ